jgi:hypothetical protein
MPPPPPPPAPIWTGPVILTLCIAALAFAMSGVALAWQIISWRRSGPRVKVKRIQGIGGTPPGVWWYGVKAENSGRLGTQVQSFGFQLACGRTIQALEDFLRQPIRLPMDLPPGGSASVMYNAAARRNVLVQGDHSGADARPYVETGHGRFEGEPIDLGAEVEKLWLADTQQ